MNSGTLVYKYDTTDLSWYPSNTTSITGYYTTPDLSHLKILREYPNSGSTGTGGYILRGYDYNNYSTTTGVTYQWPDWNRGNDLYWNEFGEPKDKPSPSQQLRDIIRRRQAPSIIIGRNRRPLQSPADIREIRARQTMRRVVGEEQFRNFLKHGFVSLRAKSGRVYQIFPGHHFTNVYENGVMIEKLCVVLQGNFPPTDSVIMRYLLLLNDEDRFIKTSNKWGADQPIAFTPHQETNELLPDIFRRLKIA